MMKLPDKLRRQRQKKKTFAGRRIKLEAGKKMERKKKLKSDCKCFHILIAFSMDLSANTEVLWTRR